MEAPFSLEPILRRYRHRRPGIQAAYELMYEQAYHLVEPRSLQHTFSPAGLPPLATCLPGAERITLAVCTIGPALEKLVADLFQEDPVSAVILDELGTLWVNGLARQLHQALRQAAHEQGKQISPSYRPGIGRWPVELQEYIFQHVPARDIGVRLVDSLIMSPQKSVSMIVATGAKLGRNCYAPGGAK